MFIAVSVNMIKYYYQVFLSKTDLMLNTMTVNASKMKAMLKT